MTMRWPSGRISTGLRSVFAVMRKNYYDDGVTARLTGLLGGPGMTVWENAFINPPDDSDHCPQRATWLRREKVGVVQGVRLLYAWSAEATTE